MVSKTPWSWVDLTKRSLIVSDLGCGAAKDLLTSTSCQKIPVKSRLWLWLYELGPVLLEIGMAFIELQYRNKLLNDSLVNFTIHRGCRAEYTDYSTLWHHTPHSNFLRVQGRFPVYVWILSWPYTVYLRINVAVQVELHFVANKEFIKRFVTPS